MLIMKKYVLDDGHSAFVVVHVAIVWGGKYRKGDLLLTLSFLVVEALDLNLMSTNDHFQLVVLQELLCLTWTVIV
jgi:hypothetical protein